MCKVHLDAVAEGEGDAFRFCRTCAFSVACLESGYDKSRLRELHVLVDHAGPYRRGDHLFREGDSFRAIAAVRTGAVKACVTDSSGREQVLGFFLPGEVVGLNAIANGRHPCDVVALQDTVLCQVSFSGMAELAARLPALQARLFSLLSADIGRAALLAGDFSARERLAAFILTLSRRYAAGGLSATRLRLPMPWTDIASHLRLAPESVSRLVKGFHEEGLLEVHRREVEVSDVRALENLAGNILRS
jgi:CRP/FNR family transcriptional regulator